MPGSCFILGLLWHPLNVCQLDNHLESSLGKFLAEVDLTAFIDSVRDKASWFWLFDGLSPSPFPCLSRYL